MLKLESLAGLCPAEHQQKLDVISSSFGFHNTVKYLACGFTAAYQDLESVKKRGGVCQAAVLLVRWVVLGNISICTSAEEDFLNATGEGITQVLDWVHHHTAVDCGAYSKEQMSFCITGFSEAV